jgi:hypothetical protein
MNFTDAQ